MAGLNTDLTASNIRDAILTIPVGSSTIGALLSDVAKQSILDNWKVIIDALYVRIKADMIITLTSHTHSGVTTGPGISGPPVAPSNIETGVVS